jgi:probable HAF family extracellular repeat protein
MNHMRGQCSLWPLPLARGRSGQGAGFAPLAGKRSTFHTLLRLAALGGCAVVVLTSSIRTANAQMYSVVELGAPMFDGSSTRVRDINNQGQAVGYEEVSGGSFMGVHAFLYSQGTRIHLGGGYQPSDYANGINDSGQVAGTSRSTAFVYSGGGMTFPGTLGGTTSGAQDINNNGQVVGSSLLAGGGTHAFLYSGGVMTDLGSLGGDSEAVAINNHGQVAGSYSTGGMNLSHAFLYDGAGMTDLGTLGGSQAGTEDINDSGQVVGWSSMGGAGGVHGFLYSDGGMTDLGTLGGDFSWAYGINNHGQVVGGTGAGAFLYSEGVMVDLNTLVASGSGWNLTYAQAINDSGEIVGLGTFGGQLRAFFLEPIPEPTVCGLLALGSLMFLTRHRFRIS